jgi:hypothetical protein
VYILYATILQTLEKNTRDHGRQPMTSLEVSMAISDAAERICQSIGRLQPPLPPTTVDQRLTVIAVIDLLRDEDTEALCHRTDSLIG